MSTYSLASPWQLAIFLIILSLSFQLIVSMSRSHKQNNTLYGIETILIIVSFAIFGYCTSPWPADDLYRYFNEMYLMSINGWSYAVNFGTWRVNFISNAILYVFSQFEDYHLLPMVTTALIPLIFFKVYKIGDKSLSASVYVLLFIEFLFGATVNIYQTISMIRFSLGCELAIMVMYLDATKTINNKLILLVLYALLPFVHTSMVVIDFTVLMANFVHNKYIKYSLFVFLPLLAGSSLATNVGSSIPIISSITSKISFYEGVYSTGTSFWLTLATFLITITIFVIVAMWPKGLADGGYNIKLSPSEVSLRLKLREYFLDTFIVALILFPFTQAIFFRFTFLMFMLGVPLLIDFFSSFREFSWKALSGLLILGGASVLWFYQWSNYFSIWQFI